jgi:uncharacterized membrane protein YidH (DUF202 family)
MGGVFWQTNGTAVFEKGITSSLLAAERTFLAWTRTVIAIVGFGMILSKFFVVNKHIATAVVLTAGSLGGIFMAWAVVRYYQIILLLLDGKFTPDFVGPGVVSVTVLLLAALLVGMIVRERCGRKYGICGMAKERGAGGGEAELGSINGDDRPLEAMLLTSAVDGTG